LPRQRGLPVGRLGAAVGSSNSRDRAGVARLRLPAALGRPGASAFQRVQNKRRLGFAVRLPVVVPASHQISLQRRIFIASGGIGRQVIAEQKLIAAPVPTGIADVHVCLARTGGRRPQEQVPFLARPKDQSRGNAGGQVGRLVAGVGNADHDVDDRLGGKARHSGGANVIDPGRRRSEGGREPDRHCVNVTAQAGSYSLISCGSPRRSLPETAGWRVG
jgi:hypothetical protein